MHEFLSALFGSMLWGAVFLALTAWINLHFLKKPAFSFAAWPASYPLFSVFDVVIVEILNMLHLLQSGPLIIVYLIIGISLLFLSLRAKRSLQLTAPSPPLFSEYVFSQKILITAAVLILLSLVFITLVIPIHFYDDHTYHMPMVANYIQNHSLSAWDTQCMRQILRVNSSELQTLNLALLTQSDSWLELPNLLALLACLAIIYETVLLIYGAPLWALLCLGIALTARQVLLTAGTASNDLALTAYILGSFYWLLEIRKKPAKAGISLGLLALTACLAIATKVLGICVYAAVLLGVGVLTVRKHLSLTQVGIFLAASFIFWVFLAGETYWRNLLHSGIPFSIVPGEDPVNLFGFRLSVFGDIYNYYIYKLGYLRLLRPQVMQVGVSHFGYLYPFLLASSTFAIAIQIIQFKKTQNPGLKLYTFLAMTLFWGITLFRRPSEFDQRFMIWLLPALSILSVSLLTRRKNCFPFLSFLVTGMAFTSFVSAYTTSPPGDLLYKSIPFILRHHTLPRLEQVPTPRGRIARALDGYAELNLKAAEKDWVLYVGGKSTWMYSSWGARFSRRVNGVSDVKDLNEKILSSQYRFIVVEKKAAENLKRAVADMAFKQGYRILFKSSNRAVLQKPDLEENL